jgi:hypothetical protein
MASVYTREQIVQFLHHIQLPEKYHHAPPSLALLKILHTHMLAAVPYENLAIHYSASQYDVLSLSFPVWHITPHMHHASPKRPNSELILYYKR